MQENANTLSLLLLFVFVCLLNNFLSTMQLIGVKVCMAACLHLQCFFTFCEGTSKWSGLAVSLQLSGKRFITAFYVHQDLRLADWSFPKM